jgi:hypothetical protein
MSKKLYEHLTKGPQVLEKYPKQNKKDTAPKAVRRLSEIASAY